MLELSKLLHFEAEEGEKRWTYTLKINFNYQSINKLTITSYYQTKPGREMITNELIWNLFQTKLHQQVLRPTNYKGSRKVYKWEEFSEERKYRIFFWFENNSKGWLWVRNIYPID